MRKLICLLALLVFTTPLFGHRSVCGYVDAEHGENKIYGGHSAEECDACDRGAGHESSDNCYRYK